MHNYNDAEVDSNLNLHESTTFHHTRNKRTARITGNTDFFYFFQSSIQYKVGNILHNRYIHSFISIYFIDASLIPTKPEDGCPNGTHELQKDKEKCCCEELCCWNNCRLDNPPMSCVDEVNAVWINDTELGYWVAQAQTGKYVQH